MTARGAAGDLRLRRQRRSARGPSTRRPGRRAGVRQRCWRGGTRNAGGWTPWATSSAAASGAATDASATSTTTSSLSPEGRIEWISPILLNPFGDLIPCGHPWSLF